MSGPPTPALVAPLDTVRERPGGRSARIRALVLDATRQELVEVGYPALSHRAVAQRAGVDPTTVYRRWPTRALLTTDALLELAGNAVPVPDTGSILTDLEGFMEAVVATVGDERVVRLVQALSSALADGEGELRETARIFWSTRFSGAQTMIARAVDRDELPPGVDAHAIIEQLVAPAYFRALLSGEPLDSAFAGRCVTLTLAAARSSA